MSLEKRCEEGKIEIAEFFEFAACKRTVRTHALSVGDYSVLPYTGREDLLALEKISELDSPEKGDFATVKGTTGPISGNVFIKIKRGNFPEYLLIEGDRLSTGNCSVYGLVSKYLENKAAGAKQPA